MWGNVLGEGDIVDEGGGWCCGDELGSLWDGSMASRQYALWYIVIAIVKVDV